MSILKNILFRSLFLLIVYCACSFSAQPASTREYQIKAAFIFNFTQFVEWPPQCFPAEKSPAIIGILGTDPFGKYLEETVSGESINNHPLLIKHFNTVDEITNCHVLFIGMTDKNKIKPIIEKLKGKNVLTISEANGFPKLGGMIRIYTKSDKINIQINLEATKGEDLVVSSKLLKIAEIVKTDKK
jgi:uncharacterized protein DUF4154